MERLNLQRYAELVKEDSASRQLRDNQQAAVDELNAQSRSTRPPSKSQGQLSYTRLVAPFDGVTGFRLLDVGNIMTRRDPRRPRATTQSNGTGSDALVLVTQLQPISVIFTLPTTSIPEVQDAMAKGTVQAIAFSQDDRTQLDVGSLLVVNNQADPGSGTIQLKAEFPNPQHQPWPGEFVNVQLVLSTLHDGLTIPLDAIQQGSAGAAGRLCGRPGSQGRDTSGLDASVAEWRSAHRQGLSAGETVVVRGQYRLSPGTLVTLANPNDPNAVPNPSTASSGMLP